MLKGKLFEIFVRTIFLYSGFTQVVSDGNYIYNAGAGQMINGLGQAHNADVLMNPPAQTPFYFPSRILVECKNYEKKIGLPIIRGTLGLREDINSFEIIDSSVLAARQNPRRTTLAYSYPRYNYQVAVASTNGFTIPAQEFALAHRIPLITFSENSVTSLGSILDLITSIEEKYSRSLPDAINIDGLGDFNIEDSVISNSKEFNAFKETANEIARRMAIAVTDEGQILFLYLNDNYNGVTFDSENYNITWRDENSCWSLTCGDKVYNFELPDKLRHFWLETATNRQNLLKNAVLCKINYLSHLVVYYAQNNEPKMKLLTIDSERLKQYMDKI